MSILEGISFFENLTANEKDNVAIFCQDRYIKSGDVLFKEGEDAIALYVVKRGKLLVYRENSDGEKKLGFVLPGEFVGEMAFFDGDNFNKKRTASVKAMEDSDLIVIMNYSMTELAGKRKDIYDKINMIIKERKLKNSLI